MLRLLGSAFHFRFMCLLLRPLDNFVVSRLSRMPCCVYRAIMLIPAFGFPFLFFFGHSETTDEFHKAVAVAFRWYWRDLGFIVRHAFPEVFGTLDEAVLYFNEL